MRQRSNDRRSTGCHWLYQWCNPFPKALAEPAARAAGAALLALVIVSLIQADDWPVVRGDTHGSGVASGTLSADLEVLWTCQAAEEAGFEATAVVADGIVYVGDNEGTFYAVRLLDGTTAWTQKFEDSGFLAGAALDKENGRLVVGDAVQTVRCLSMEDGHELWKAEVEAEVYAGPTLHEGGVLVACEAGTLSCFNAETGEGRWKFRIEAPLRCTPTLVAGRALLAGCDGLLHVIDVADGAEVGSVPIDAPTGATAATRGKVAYFGTEAGTFFAVEINEAHPDKPQVAWTFSDPDRRQPIRAAAAVTDTLVAYGTQGKAVYGLDPRTGQLKWRLPQRSRVDSSPVIAGRRVVAATMGGKLLVVDTVKGEEQWSFDAGGHFAASPVVVDGRIVIGNTDGTLYCFGTKTDAKNELAPEDTESTQKKER